MFGEQMMLMQSLSTQMNNIVGGMESLGDLPRRKTWKDTASYKEAKVIADKSWKLHVRQRAAGMEDGMPVYRSQYSVDVERDKLSLSDRLRLSEKFLIKVVGNALEDETLRVGALNSIGRTVGPSLISMVSRRDVAKRNLDEGDDDYKGQFKAASRELGKVSGRVHRLANKIEKVAEVGGTPEAVKEAARYVLRDLRIGL